VSSGTLSAAFGSDLAELERARDRVRAHLERAGVDEAALYAVDLALEELAGNAIRHGKARTIRIEVEVEASVVRVTLADDGRPFDPTRHPEPARARTLADASIGGRGISLVRRFARAMRYQRDADGNRLVVEVARASTSAATRSSVPANPPPSDL
jgi:anti-sigma regulatory factor (Ser/Thr protein kinase)